MGRGFHSYVSLLEGNYISWHTFIYIPICVGMILSQILYIPLYPHDTQFMTSHGGIPTTMKPWQPWDDLGGKPVNPQLWPN